MTKSQIGMSKAHELLLEKYKLLVPQIIHWDKHFWAKSKFFMTIETAFLGGILALLHHKYI